MRIWVARGKHIGIGLACLALLVMGACGPRSTVSDSPSSGGASPASSANHEETGAADHSGGESHSGEASTETDDYYSSSSDAPEAETASPETPAADTEYAEPGTAEEEVVGEEADEAEAAEEAPAEPAAAAPEEHIVEISNFAFVPEKLEIKAGDRVTFVNKDEVAHTATADDKSFDTGLLQLNEKDQIAFAQAGEFSYYCAPHPGMKGTIVVTNPN